MPHVNVADGSAFSYTNATLVISFEEMVLVASRL